MGSHDSSSSRSMDGRKFPAPASSAAVAGEFAPFMRNQVAFRADLVKISGAAAD